MHEDEREPRRCRATQASARSVVALSLTNLPLCCLFSSTSLHVEMASQISTGYPPELSESQREYLLSNLKDWSIAHGLAVRPTAYVLTEQDPSGALATTAPVTLFPSLFPRGCYQQANGIQTAYNELYAAIASDEAWLEEIIKE